MPKEDYLLKYLEKLSRVIAAMLGLREKGFSEDALRFADETYKELISLDLEVLASMPVADFDTLIRKLGYSSTYIEALAKLALETTYCYAETGEKPKMRIFGEKALLLYRLLNEKDKTFSFEREVIITQLNDLIDSH
jgi:hypothetical protein